MPSPDDNADIPGIFGAMTARPPSNITASVHARLLNRSRETGEGARVVRAIKATFERRRTPIEPALPAALTPRFFADVGRTQQWRSYLFRSNLPGVPEDFAVLGKVIISFLVPVWGAIAERSTFDLIWPPGGPWEPIVMEG